MLIDVISSYKFSRESDFVFSEVVTKEQFKDLDLKDITVLYNNDSHICYQSNFLRVSNGDVIFSTNTALNNLFHLVRKTDAKNLVLITNQTDDNISKHLFNKLPENFSKWFSINVNYSDNKLISIPLGFANGYEKNLTIAHDKIDLDIANYKYRKKNLLYLSFQEITNIRKRYGLKQHFKKYNWTKIADNSNSLKSYNDDLKTSNFVLCPEGNGIDTHRVWETLYNGSIPVIEKQKGLNAFKSLPILYVDSFYEVNEKVLTSYLDNLKIDDLRMLDFKYWKSLIFENLANESKEFSVSLNNMYFKYTLIKQMLVNKFLKAKNGYYRILYKFIRKLNIQIKK